MDKRIPKSVQGFVLSFGLVVKHHYSGCCVKFCQITTLTQTHRSELVQCVSTQDRIYGFMPIGIAGRGFPLTGSAEDFKQTNIPCDVRTSTQE